MIARSTVLTRSSTDRLIAGVLGGVARYLGLSPLVVRILFVVISVFSAAFPGLIVYGLLWLVMPKAGVRTV